MTTTYIRTSQDTVIGWLPSGINLTATSLNLNTATTFIAFAFTAKATGLTAFMFDISAVTGTVVAANITGQVYTDNGSGPSSTVGSAGALSANPATGWNTITGISSGTLTLNQTYWMVIKNINGTPASNSVTVRCNPGMLSAKSLSYKSVTTTDGTTWTTGITTNTWRAYDSASDTYWGCPSSTMQAFGSPERIQGSLQTGIRFTTPPGVSLNVIGIGFNASKTGTPAGNIGMKLYNSGGTLIATADEHFVTELGTGTPAPVFFRLPTTQTLSPSTNYYAMCYDAGASTGANYYFMWKAPFENSTATDNLRFLGSKLFTLSAGTFTEVTGYTVPFYILLEPQNEFSVAAGGGPSSYMFSG